MKHLSGPLPERNAKKIGDFGHPDRAEHDMLGLVLDVFWPIQEAFLVGEPLCQVAIPF